MKDGQRSGSLKKGTPTVQFRLKPKQVASRQQKTKLLVQKQQGLRLQLRRVLDERCDSDGHPTDFCGQKLGLEGRPQIEQQSSRTSWRTRVVKVKNEGKVQRLRT